MKIIGLLFGLYLGSIMSVQAQDLSKDATSIITEATGHGSGVAG